MLYIIFGLAAVVTVIAAVHLSSYADILSEKTRLSGLLVGTLLLGGATSLPELTTSMSSVFIGNKDIAVGNMLGSNLFNIFIIAVFDLYFRRQRIFESADRAHVYTAGLGLVLTLMTVIAIARHVSYTIVGIGVDALLIAFVYGIGIYIIGTRSAMGSEANMEVEKEVDSHPSVTRNQAFIGFIVSALVIMAAGSVLSFMGDEIAVVTGLGSSFVGSFLMAATTSLPEAAVVLMALKLGNSNLAVGSILGSNIFNMLILTASDVIYREGPILSNVSPIHEFTSISLSFLSVVLILAIMRRKVRSGWRYSLPSLVMIAVYFLTSYVIFNG
ncbi:sodium:calcium antiporter [Jeotgalibacillus soli]|uniref:Cation transporter n=1 Tax=Jeotgalibacillus soli TaxID=889306 RepID=A0A0C2VSY9_9BACL|nr:sodium:calcium antiporter [Jeotgalibacillus soli]KIL52022.1 cation transporter [Jeotgalibacillus soli]